MRIHGNNITATDIREAATLSRVTLDRFNEHGSRSHTRAFDITLQGESRRHQNGGTGKAATWDQWGVFLACLFSKDDTLTIPRIYSDFAEFQFRTDYRFSDGANVVWPSDAHGDHRFEFVGVPYSQTCRKCSATNRWQ